MAENALKQALGAALSAIRAVAGSAKNALAHALKQNALRRVRRPDPLAEPLPGYRVGPDSVKARAEILAQVREVFGEDKARECSWVLCEPGAVPTPMGVPSTSSSKKQITPVISRCFEAIGCFVRRHYSKQEIVGLSVPKKSTFGYPYYISGPDSLPLRELYFRSYEKNLSWYQDMLAEDNWKALNAGRGDALPIHEVMSVNYRLQPQQAVELMWNGRELAGVRFKDRELMDASGAYRIMDWHLKYSKLGSTMRARSINQIPGDSNQLAQANENTYRVPYYRDNALFKVISIPDRAKEYRAQFSDIDDFEFGSFDFGGMEKSCDAAVWQVKVSNMAKAGCSQAFINLLSALHYGAYLTGEDDYTRKPALPVKLHGYLSSPNVLNDLGHRSGEAPTDTDNKDVGAGIYTEGVFETGGFGPQAKHHRNVTSFLEEFGPDYVFQGRRVPEAPYGIMANSGDDCATGGSRKFKLALAEWLLTLAPYFDIKLEKDTQYLGEELHNNGDAYPYMGKFFSNILSKERSWYSRMRIKNWPLGVFAFFEHFSRHPDYRGYLDILNDVTLKTWGATPLELAEREARGQSIPRAYSISDMIFLNDPTSISWGRIAAEDVSPELLEMEDFYLNIPPERVEHLIL
jgi:hypothetical protein